MSRAPFGKHNKLSISLLMGGVACFGIAVLLIFGSMRLYVLRQEIEETRETILELQNQVGTMKSLLTAETHDAVQRAEELGMILPEQEEIVILHIGR